VLDCKIIYILLIGGRELTCEDNIKMNVKQLRLGFCGILWFVKDKNFEIFEIVSDLQKNSPLWS
jgi:hypothetical protein